MLTKFSEQKEPALNRYRALQKVNQQNRRERAVLLVVCSLLLISFALRLSGFSPPEAKNNAIAGGSRMLIEEREELSMSGAALIPFRLLIPSIGVDAPVEQVGMNNRGEMGIPSGYQETAWYKDGFKPGENGSAVINGHLDTRFFNAGVFRRLDELGVGEEVIVLGANGERLVFEVIGSESYDEKNAPLAKIFGSAGEARLNLITCDGTWDQSVKRYDQRLVVYTKMKAQD